MQPRAACRRTRAPQRLGAVAGLAPPLRRVGRRRRRVPAGRTTLVSFPAARAVSWCCSEPPQLNSVPHRRDRRRAPPSATERRRLLPASRSLASCAAGSRSSGLDLNPPPRHLRMTRAVGSRSDASRRHHLIPLPAAVRSRSDGSDQPDPGSIPVNPA
jgi:hypothetical protein